MSVFFTKKFLSTMCVCFLLIGGANALACSDDNGHNIVSYDYNSTTGFIELGITFDGYMDDMCWDGCWTEYSGFVDSSKDPFAGLYLYGPDAKYLGGARYVSGCGYHASSGLEWASATTGNTCTVCFSELWTYSSYDYSTTLLLSSSGTCLTKAEIDGYLGSDSLENRRVDGIVLHDSDANFSLYGTANTNFDWATCDLKVGSVAPPPVPVDATCGSSDRQTYSYPTTLPEDFCATGELITPSLVYDGYGWNWSCSGLYGGESVSCEAYNSSSVDAVCGADDGGTFSSTSEMTEACSIGSLIFPSFVETSSGWTWICAGINGGSQAYCSATLSTTTYPTLPTEEDCSSYTFPDKWICEIKNLLTSAFLPSESKLNELNIAINSFQGKAPFNYLSSASNKFNDLKNGISESDLNITLMSNTSEVNLNDLTGLYDIIKGFFTIMVVLAFIFWGVGYIKHFFK